MKTYTLQRGDSLSKLAARFNTSVTALAKANHIADPNRVQAGRKLVIPDSFEAPRPSNPTPAKGDGFTPASTGSSATASTGSARDSNGRVHPTSADGTPMFKQGDKEWGSRTLGTGLSVGGQGCAMTATAMAISKISGKTINPGQLDATLDKNNGYAGNGLKWDVAAKAAGLGHQKPAWSLETINKQVDAGRPVVVGVDYRAGSGGGANGTDHYVTITGREKGANGKSVYLANDPATGKQFKFHEVGGKLVSDYKARNGRSYETTGVLHTFTGGSPAKPGATPTAKRPGTEAPSTRSSGPAVVQSTAKPTTSGDWKKDSAAIHSALGITGSSEKLSKEQISKAMDMASKMYGVPKERLMHIAQHESSNNQTADNGAARGLMQIERVHTDAYKGQPNVGNDTISNIVYAAKVQGQAVQAINTSFEKQGLKPPTGKTLAVLTDFVYNRGNGVAPLIAKYAKQQGIDTNNIQEYFAGKGGKFSISSGAKPHFEPGAGVGAHGERSVLQNAVSEIGNPTGFRTDNKRDRSGNGKVDHFDIWIQRAAGMI
jgi:LysM domain/Peptidase_C39 like family/Transglycosylase SLT domain